MDGEVAAREELRNEEGAGWAGSVGGILVKGVKERDGEAKQGPILTQKEVVDAHTAGVHVVLWKSMENKYQNQNQNNIKINIKII